MKNFFKSLIGVIVIVLLIVFIITISHHKSNNISNDEDSITADCVYTDTAAPTVSEVLEMREELRLAKYVDSVYLALPKQILTAILVTEGTKLSPKQIVNTYIINKSFYDDFIQKTMDIQKNYNPDSLGKSQIPKASEDSTKKKIETLIKTNK